MTVVMGNSGGQLHIDELPGSRGAAPGASQAEIRFWAKTTLDGRAGISVRDHCLNVGCITETIINTLPETVRKLLPQGAATLAALHDLGKITVGFQAKCPQWLCLTALPQAGSGEIALSITDHALVSQRFLQSLP